MIDLAKNREVALQTPSDHVFRFELARISPTQWMKYFAGVVSTSEIKGRELIRSFDSSKARMELVASALVSAEGYRLPEGRTLAEIPGWQEKIPVAHCTAIGDILTRVRPIDSADEIELGEEVVRLAVLWGVSDKGNMLARTVVHRFQTPSSDQTHRYMRDLSRAKIVGGSRTGKTIDLGAQTTLAELYDELIVSVEGYAVNGAALGLADEIRREMDVYHKVAAAERLFAPQAVEEEEEKQEA